MKLCVFSDSHGHPSKMLSCIEQQSPDMIVHLGDGAADVEKIKMQFPQIPLKAVRGNCDYSSALPEKDFFSVNGVGIFITHGHLYGVKGAPDALLNAAHLSGAAVAMFGHTHRAVVKEQSGIDLLNPGACGLVPNSSYAVVNISDTGGISCKVIEFSKNN